MRIRHIFLVMLFILLFNVQPAAGQLEYANEFVREHSAIAEAIMKMPHELIYRSGHKVLFRFTGRVSSRASYLPSSVALTVLVDLDDLADITQEGRDGWATVWIDLSTSFHYSFVALGESSPPFSYGDGLIIVDRTPPNEDDPTRSLQIALCEVGTPYFVVKGGVIRKGTPAPVDPLDLTAEVSVGASLFSLDLLKTSSNLVRFEINKNELLKVINTSLVNTAEQMLPSVVCDLAERIVNKIAGFDLTGQITSPMSASLLRGFTNSDDPHVQATNNVGFVAFGKSVPTLSSIDITDCLVAPSPSGNHEHFRLKLYSDAFEQLDLVVEVKGVPAGWDIQSLNSNTGQKFGSTYELPNATANTTFITDWAVRCTESAPEQARVMFVLWKTAFLDPTWHGLDTVYVTFVKPSSVKPTFVSAEISNEHQNLITVHWNGTMDPTSLRLATTLSSSSRGNLDFVDTFDPRTRCYYIMPTDGIHEGETIHLAISSSAKDLYGNSLSTAVAADVSKPLSLSVISPGGGETLVRDFEYTLRWEDGNAGSRYTLRLRSDGGTVVPIASALAGTSYRWKVPMTTEVRNDYRLEVLREGAGISDQSDGRFSIVASIPHGVVLSATPSSIVYSGSDKTTLTASVTNANGTPMAGIPLSFVSYKKGLPEDLTGAISPAEVVTDASGIAHSTFSPGESGPVVVEAVTPSGLTGKTEIDVRSAGASTYSIVLRHRVVDRTATSVTFQLDPLVTYTSSGDSVEAQYITMTTTLGAFQNGQQTMTVLIGGSNGPGRVDGASMPSITTFSPGLATIGLTVGPTIVTTTIEMIPGLLPKIAPFYTIPGAGFSTNDTESEVVWSEDGKFFVSAPGMVYEVPSLTTLFGGPPSNAKTFAFSKAGTKVLMGRNSDNPVFYLYDRTTSELTSYNPSLIIAHAVAWSDQTDDIKFAIANSYAGHCDEVILFEGSGFSRTYLRTGSPSDVITAIDWKGDYLAVVTVGGAIHFFRPSLGTSPSWSVSTNKPKYGVAISPDKTKLAVIGRLTSGTTNLQVYTIGAAIPTQFALGGGNGDYTSVSWSPDGKSLVCCGVNGYARIIDPLTGSELYALDIGGDVHGGQWSSTGLIAATNRSEVRLYAPLDQDGPIITVSSPVPGTLAAQESVMVAGTIHDVIGVGTSQIAIDQGIPEDLALSADGAFSAKVHFGQYSSRTVRIRATDRKGKASEVQVTLLRALPSIVLRTPSLDVQWVAGMTTPVAWQRSPMIPFVDVLLTVDGGSSAPLVLAKQIADTDSISVTVPNFPTASGRLRIVSSQDSTIFSRNSPTIAIRSTPIAPVSVSPFDGEKNVNRQVTLQWRSVPGAVAYRAQVCRTSNFTSDVIEVGPVSGTSAKVLLPNYGTRYFWRIVPEGSVGRGDTSVASQFTVETHPLASGLSANLLDFGLATVQDSVIRRVYVRNTSDAPFSIDSASNSLRGYRLLQTLPRNVGAQDSTALDIQFRPSEPGRTRDTMYLYSGGVSAMVRLSGGTILGVERIDGGIPAAFAVSECFPNPFNPETRFQFSLPTSCEVTVEIFDVQGRRVLISEEGVHIAGRYEMRWKPQVASGVYFLRFLASPVNSSRAPFLSVKKMLLLK